MIPHVIEYKSRQDLLLDSLKLETFHCPSKLIFISYLHILLFTILSLLSDWFPHCLIIPYIALPLCSCSRHQICSWMPSLMSLRIQMWLSSKTKFSLVTQLNPSLTIVAHYQSFSHIHSSVHCLYMSFSNCIISFIRLTFSIPGFLSAKNCCSVLPSGTRCMPSSSSYIQLVFYKYLLIDRKYSE